MEIGALLLMLVLMSPTLSGYTQARPKVQVTAMPSDRVFSGETVTLRCDIEEEADWTYSWYKDGLITSCTERVYEFTSYESDSDLPRATITADPDRSVFTGETVSLKCAIESHYSDWRFQWSKYSSTFDAGEPEKNTSRETLTIESVSKSDQDKYHCWGERESRPMKSQQSVAFSIKVEDSAQAVLMIYPQNWLTEGDSVTLTCEVRSSSRGWMFSWYRDDYNLLSDSRRGAQGSYTISPAAVKHTGVYMCRAERGGYYTEYSHTELLWVITRWPLASPNINPSRSQHFHTDSLSLSCEGQSSSGWRLRRYSKRPENCSSFDWGSETGSTRRISSLKTSDTGVYWCQSESGEHSQPVNITVHDGDVILDTSVYPVTEGDSITLRCLQRSTNASNLRAVFYYDRSLLQTQTTGQMIIPTVTKSHEGFYYCKLQEGGKSPKSWISVTESQSEYQISVFKMISSVLAASPYLLLSIILGVKCYRARAPVCHLPAEDCNGFLLQCSLVVEMQLYLYPNDHAEVAFIISQLNGKALRWAEPLWSQKNPITQSLSSFIAHFKEVFGRPAWDSSIGEQLYQLKQGSMTVNEYALQFRTLAAASGLNEQSLITTYHQGSDPRVRLHLTAYEDSIGLERFIQLSIRFATHMQSCLKEHQGQPLFPSSLRRPESVSSPEPASEPMQVENTRLSMTERQRRLTQNLCLYCGLSGHYISECPTRPACPLVSVIIPSINKMKPLTTVVSLTAAGVSLPVSALLDSGSAGNFISGALCRQLKLKTTATLSTYQIHSVTRPWDCAIDLHPGEPGKIYSLSIPEEKAMEEYIKEALSQGYIRPSTSPAAFQLLLHGKKGWRLAALQ
ncbi:uncharacterized protein LOC127516027 isoform X2 [Ctenopharyngodon idella]|uniref:uncharacterized protein LOC127516027 isoform X2 n=1 Tax=Ctenopharyngodon idella TaxID=7959 RepID=UPI00222E303C|nr:uncharacterized protein LOC127516027 isoform X2 [Ctenopharyngodon idella]